MAGPSSAQFNQELGNRLFQLIESLGASGLNQINRIGGTEEIPLYSPDMTYQEVFENAGYSQVPATLLAGLTGITEPGPGDALKLVEALGALGPLTMLNRRIRNYSTPTASTTGTVPTERVSEWPGFSDEDLPIYQTGNIMDDPRTARMVQHLQETGPEGLGNIELSVYPEGWSPPNPDRPSNVFVKDGNHRVAAAKFLGWDEVPVEITYHGGAEAETGQEFLDLIRDLSSGGR